MWVLFYHYTLQFILYIKYREKSTPEEIQPGQRIRGPCFLNSVINWPNLHFLLHIFNRPILLEIPWVSPALWVVTKLFSMETSGAKPSAGRVYPTGQCSDGNNSAAISAVLHQEMPLCLCSKQSLRGSLSTNPATGWDRFMPPENISWDIFKCTGRHKFLCQQTVQDKDEIFTFLLLS